MAEFVQVVNGATGTGTWTPAVGREAERFLKTIVPEASRDGLTQTAARILARGVQPGDLTPQSSTGLAVGYVQSGKTMAFELLAAMGSDNGFGIVIVLAGVANALLEQSVGRLVNDLAVRQDGSKWILFRNPDTADLAPMRTRLALHKDGKAPPHLVKALLVPILKHHKRINETAAVLERLDLEGVPVLVIDDEADQAGLNAEVQNNDESATYHAIRRLRNSLQRHAYVQFTATPQAPLLISLADTLSPDFVEVLQPGPGYIGGKEMFLERPGDVVRSIPAAEVPDPKEPFDAPPESLLSALRLFVLGAAAEMSKGQTKTRSMLVHPSQRVVLHAVYARWIRTALEAWRMQFDLDTGDPAFLEFVEGFRQEYEDLEETLGHDAPPFDQVLAAMRYVLLSTRVEEVNASSTSSDGGPRIDWSASEYWVLVGGQVLDRGFTVEGLTVTYMPRRPGVGNADTVQQRGRFFGYKSHYIDYCRVFLEEQTRSAFENYVRHEEDIRRQLIDVSERGQSLDDWKRAFVLDSSLKPCRKDVLESGFIRFDFVDKWTEQSVVVPTGSNSHGLNENRNVVRAFIEANEVSWTNDTGSPERKAVQRHKVLRNVGIRDVLEELLEPYRTFSSRDAAAHVALMLLLELHSEEYPEEAFADVYLMSPSQRRRRSISSSGGVQALMQGAAPVNPESRRGSIYKGDRNIIDRSKYTVQIHCVDVTEGRRRDARVLDRDVPVLAHWVPETIGDKYVVQDQI